MGLTGDHRGNLLSRISWNVKMGRRTSSLSEKGTIDLQSAEHFITSNCPKQPNLVCAVTLSPNTDIETLVLPTSSTVQDSAHSHHDSALRAGKSDFAPAHSWRKHWNNSCYSCLKRVLDFVPKFIQYFIGS